MMDKHLVPFDGIGNGVQWHAVHMYSLMLCHNAMRHGRDFSSFMYKSFWNSVIDDF